MNIDKSSSITSDSFCHTKEKAIHIPADGWFYFCLTPPVLPQALVCQER
jgi:hypothetical protein